MFRANSIRNSVVQLIRTAAQSNRCVSGIAATKDLEAKNLQETALAENCILVDEFDRPLGQSSKRDCHRVDENGRIKLHRAFSVFLFNSKGDMLIQKRSSHKVVYPFRNPSTLYYLLEYSFMNCFQITFPDCYTNACCSHPLHDIEGEREEINAMGIRKAAQRRLNYELGIPYSQASAISLSNCRY